MAERILPEAGLSPVAAAVSQYVSPERVVASEGSLAQLARTLQAVNPQLQGFITAVQNDNAMRDEAAGAAAEQHIDPNVGLEANREGWSKLIASARRSDEANGTHYADQLVGASPHFRRGLVTAKANRIGLGLSTELQYRWQKNEDGIKNIDDPAAVQEWVQRVTNDYSERMGILEIDPVITAKTYTPRVASTQLALFDKHMAYRSAQRAASYKEELKRQAYALMMATDQALSGAETAAQFQSVLDDAVANGMDPKAANKAVVDAVILYSRETGNADALSLLDEVSTPYGPLSNIMEVRGAVLDAEESILDAEWQNETREYTRAERKDAQARSDLLTAGFGAVLNDPWADISQHVDVAVMGRYPAVMTQLHNFQRQLQSETYEVRTNHEAVIAIRRDIFSGDVNKDEIVGEIMAGTGTLFNSSTALSLMDDLDNANKNVDYVRDPAIRQNINRAVSIVTDRFSSRDIWGAASSVGTVQALEFENEINDRIILFTEQNPEASLTAVRLHVREEADKMLKEERYSSAQAPTEALFMGKTQAELKDAADARGMTVQQLMALLIQKSQENKQNQ